MTETMQMSLRQYRLHIVETAIEATNQHDIDAVLALYGHPHFEIVALNIISDGAEAVRLVLRAFHEGFPNLYTDVFHTHYSDDAVIVEGSLVGTHLATWAGIQALGRVMNVPYAAIYHFDEDRLQSHKLYFDLNTVLKQLTGL